MTRAYVLDPVTRATLGLVDQSWERLSYVRRYVAMDTFELVINRTRLWASELAESASCTCPTRATSCSSSSRSRASPRGARATTR